MSCSESQLRERRKMAYKSIYYKLMTLDAAEILASGKKTEGTYAFELDLNKALERARYVLKVEDHADCAMFRQIMLAKGNGSDETDRDKGTDEHDPKALYGELIYLDFSRVFKEIITMDNPLFSVLVGMDKEQKQDEIDARGSALMENGLRLKLKGDEECKAFYPFDKSGNMSREGRITFVSGELYDEVDERVRLGIDFKNIEVLPSKYFSYRGLYMSTGKRIIGLAPGKELNEETVIVIPDAKYKSGKVDIVTCDDRRNEEGYLSLVGAEGSPEVIHGFEIPVNSFDGEGIISEKYAGKINDSLFGEGNSEAASFQCRMPFVKGMLHTVDFKRFLMVQLGLDSLDGVMIKDRFKRFRDLSKVEVILTESMFKCADWVKEAAGDHDPMEFYFKRAKDYDHALYITNTSRSFEDVDKVKLNYQFINTIDFTSSEIETLMVNHFEEARDMRLDPDKARRALLRRQEMLDPDEGNDYDGDEEDKEGLELPVWKYALRRNKYFMHDHYFQKKLKDMSVGMKQNASLGKIFVDGAICFLSGDLLSFMIHVIERIGEAEQTVQISTEKRINELSDQRIMGDEFYLPGYKNFRHLDPGSNGKGDRYFTEGQYYGILRSPHLSRNEQCMMTPCPDGKSLYEEYFGRLKGILMVPRDSAVPAALSGADFDGDTVKLFAEDIVNNAIKRAFEKTSSGYERDLPVAFIPPRSGRRKKAPERIDFEQLKSTFSNKVGHISNVALKIGEYEYWDESRKEEYENWSALCTIATGLEIDSVKTGVRPDLRLIDEMRGDETDRFLRSKYAKERYGVTTDVPEDEGPGLRPIDWLEAISLIENAKEPGKRRPKDIKAAKDKMFNDKCIDERVAETKGIDAKEIAGIIAAYIKANKKIHDIREKEKRTENNAYIEAVRACVFAEYDPAVDKLAESGAPVVDAINGMMQAFEKKITGASLENVDAAIAKLYGEKWEDWIFAGSYDQKLSVLSEILSDVIDMDELPDYAVELLCDTHKNGYQILGFVLYHAYGTLVEALDKKEKIEALKKMTSASGEESEEYDKELCAIMCEAYDDKESNPYWERAAKSICREKIKSLFDEDMERAAAFCLRNSDEIDKEHKFFWEWFKANEIKELLADEKEEPEVRDA